jgi:hypothetical protein
MAEKNINLSGRATDVLYALFSVVRCKVAICHLNLVQHSFASWGWLKPDTPQQSMGR